ncbi:hypothetical protein BGX26_010769 [Mortierella sp. AD094]|nr:hypothetical protein BGX26_010769 [Mortierella sp. AD094]
MHFTQQLIFVIAAILAIFTATTEAGSKSGTATFYSGAGMVACNGANLQGNWHTAAVNFASWGGLKHACFECVKVTANRRSVIVRVIDQCVSCSSNQLDLTTSAFKILGSTDLGHLSVKYEIVKCPKSGPWPSK